MTQDELKYIQKELSYTVQQMADSLNVNKSTYEYWLYGKINIPIVYENYLKGMQLALEKNKKEALKKELAKASLIALGAFALSFLWDNTPNEGYKDED